MENIKEIVADLMECYDGTGIPNQHYVKNKVAELHNIVKNLTIPDVTDNKVVVCQCFDSKSVMHQSTGEVCDGCEFK